MNKIKKLSHVRDDGRTYIGKVNLAQAVWNENNKDDRWERGFVIHHLDGNKANDTIDNLVKLKKKDHDVLHKSKHIDKVDEIIKMIAEQKNITVDDVKEISKELLEDRFGDSKDDIENGIRQVVVDDKGKYKVNRKGNDKGKGSSNGTVVNGKDKTIKTNKLEVNKTNRVVVEHVYSQKNQSPDPSTLPGPTYPALLPKSDMNPSKMKRIPNELIAKALMENNHKISYAAKALNVAHWTLKKRIDKEPELKKLLTVGKEAELDYIENKFMDQVKKDNIAAIIFYLKCQGKHRGWIEKPMEEKTNKPNITFKYTVVANKQQRKIPNNKVIDMGTIEAE